MHADTCSRCVLCTAVFPASPARASLQETQSKQATCICSVLDSTEQTAMSCSAELSDMFLPDNPACQPPRHKQQVRAMHNSASCKHLLQSMHSKQATYTCCMFGMPEQAKLSILCESQRRVLQDWCI
jgi:hypothetical protein